MARGMPLPAGRVRFCRRDQDESDEFQKADAQTIEFRVHIPPDRKKIITYTAHYSW
jgi:hypothetical protein